MDAALNRAAHISNDEWERARRDLETYKRRLPDLLDEGHAGRFAIIKDDQVLSIWDTLGDALQAAGDRFGTVPVATFKINPLDVERFAILDAQVPREGKELGCPA